MSEYEKTVQLVYKTLAGNPLVRETLLSPGATRELNTLFVGALLDELCKRNPEFRELWETSPSKAKDKFCFDIVAALDAVRRNENCEFKN